MNIFFPNGMYQWVDRQQVNVLSSNLYVLNQLVSTHGGRVASNNQVDKMSDWCTLEFYFYFLSIEDVYLA